MTQEQVQQGPDRKDLKIQALINKVTKTENENADYQVELHLKTEELQQAQNELMSLRTQLGNLEAAQQASQESQTLPEVVSGEVVPEEDTTSSAE